MAPAIYGLRLWMAFITLVNLVIVITHHAYLIPLSNKITAERFRQMYEEGITDIDYDFQYEYYWGDYAIIISSVLLLPAYLYSIWGKRSLVSNKHARAVLMLLPALFMIGVQLRQVDLTIIYFKMLNERHRGYTEDIDPFSCANTDTDGIVGANCALLQSYTFIPIVVGFFVIIEVAVTFFRGPLHPPKEACL